MPAEKLTREEKAAIRAWEKYMKTLLQKESKTRFSRKRKRNDEPRRSGGF